MTSLKVKQAKENARIFVEEAKGRVDAETKNTLSTIFIYSIIVFLSMFFFLNLLKGNLIANWWSIILNFIGAGCTYYLFIDCFEFIVVNIKAK